MAHPSDQQLITAILDATATLSTRERQRATGISHYTFSRFSRGPGKGKTWRLQGSTREKIVRYLKARKKMPEPTSAPEELPDPVRKRLIEIFEEALRLLKEP